MAQSDVVIEKPPDVPKVVPVNPLARLAPLAMLVAAGGMMAVYFTSGATPMRNPMFMFFPVMMLSSVIGTLAYGRGANRTAEINEHRRSYLHYLDTLDSAIARTTDDQHLSLRWSHPEPEDLWTLIGGQRMWERRSGDADFCHVRVGCGDRRLSTRLVRPELGPAEELDPVTVSAMRRLFRLRSVVTCLPIAVPFQTFSAITIHGEANAARALLRAVICQLAVMHGPENVAIAAVVCAGTRDEWDWLKWLPHHQHSRAVDTVGSVRLQYGNVSQAVNEARAPDGASPRHVVVILDGGVATGAEQVGAGDAVTIVEVDATPETKATTSRLRLCIAPDGLLIESDDGSEDVIGQPDSLTLVQATMCARRLAQYRPAPATADGSHPAPAPFGWLGLMGIDNAARIDLDDRWRRSGGRILPVPIGVSEDGSPLYLDINEAARNGVGPHGLCVGATGSGKSEFLRTLALGMITMHSPDVLNLILVDFKGGATFLGLERAQHVAAVITNLAEEAHLVTRMKEALSGEMNRRQELLRAAGGFANVSEYESFRLRGTTMPPLPALFILVDEFSEMLSQHPEFAELFVAIGRLGRSLGMHLLLASQRLDEGRLRGLETHLSYRICLKTFSASESRAVLGVPDAHHLPSSPGAAYLKTAPGDLVRFQTAFVSGADGARRSESVTTRTVPLQPILFTAAPVGTTSEDDDVVVRSSAPVRTVLDAVLDQAAGRGRPAHRVWLPPLVESPTLDTLMNAAGPRDLTVPIGLVDNPFEQRRDLLIAELDGAAGNVAVVGAPRSGKSTALRTLLLALADVHDPQQVGFYCLDFGGGALSSMREVPHVGSVATRADADLCRRTVAVMESVIRERETRFRRLGIDSIAEYRRLRSVDPAVVDDPFGDVFLVVDGWATLHQEFESLEGPITAIASRGLSYGVHVVVTASRWAELRPALKDQIATRIELRLGDPADSEMDRKRARELSGRPPGRGMTASGREMLIALSRWDGKATADRLHSRWNERCAPAVELLPMHLSHHHLVPLADEDRSPMRLLIGLGERELEPIAVDFAEHSHLLVLGESGCGKTAVLRLLCREIIRTTGAEAARLEIVDFRRTLLGVVETDHLAGYAMSPASLTSRLQAILDTLNARMPGENVTQQQLRTRSWWSGPEIYLVIDDYDLAAGATGNPLTPLADFLPHAKDLGLHLVVARRSGGAARAMFDPVLARLRELGCAGLMMSASPDDGVLLGSVRPSPLPPGRGTLITRADADQIIQVAWTDPP